MGGGVEGQEVRDLPPSKTHFVIRIPLGHFIGRAGWLAGCSNTAFCSTYLGTYLTFLTLPLHIKPFARKAPVGTSILDIPQQQQNENCFFDSMLSSCRTLVPS